jgi:TM2 domain-containing membrane protein YozV
MSLKRLIVTLALCVVGIFVVTSLYGVLTDYALRPLENQVVEAQLGNSNAAPVMNQLYHNIAFSILMVLYAVFIAISGVAGYKFYRSRKDAK